MKRLLTVLAFYCVLVGLSACATMEADSGGEVESGAAQAIAKLRERLPRTNRYFEEAYGYAIFPSVTRVGFGFGGAYGKGSVVERNITIGTSKYWQFTSGIQAGARNFSMIIFFKDKEALAYYQAGKMQFMGQAGMAVGTIGAAGTPAYNEGVAIVTMTRFGLMGEFTVSGARFSYKPIVAK